jgi:hypothetical protein
MKQIFSSHVNRSEPCTRDRDSGLLPSWRQGFGLQRVETNDRLGMRDLRTTTAHAAAPHRRPNSAHNVAAQSSSAFSFHALASINQHVCSETFFLAWVPFPLRPPKPLCVLCNEPDAQRRASSATLQFQTCLSSTAETIPILMHLPMEELGHTIAAICMLAPKRLHVPLQTHGVGHRRWCDERTGGGAT